jgi:hypothetical protein
MTQMEKARESANIELGNCTVKNKPVSSKKKG